MKRRNAIILAAAGLCVLGAALPWSAWSRVSLEQATVVLPAAGHAPPLGKGDLMAIIYSGDGGWADLDKQLGNAFAASGIPILGVNTFKYYWRQRTADESAKQLDDLINQYVAKWDKPRIWMIGFSFGADVLPSIIDRLSPTNRERITQLVLLSPTRDVVFEIELQGYMAQQGWLSKTVKTALQYISPTRHYPALLPLQTLQGKPPVVCYYGLEDGNDSLCDRAGLPTSVKVHAKQGGHHFDGGYQALARQMLDELPKPPSAGVIPDESGP